MSNMDLNKMHGMAKQMSEDFFPCDLKSFGESVLFLLDVAKLAEAYGLCSWDEGWIKSLPDDPYVQITDTK